MYKICVIGDSDSILGFQALGMDVFPVTSEDAPAILRQTAMQDYAVIYITEQFCEICSKEITKYRDSPLPVIIPIPGSEGLTGFGMESIRQTALRAIGSDIVFGEE